MGKMALSNLAGQLKEIATLIPEDIDWFLRVEGHTDARPVTKSFQSNWHLSAERALAAVGVLIEQGISPDRLSAAGFGAHRPLVDGDTEEAYRRNRRIEFKLDRHIDS